MSTAITTIRRRNVTLVAFRPVVSRRRRMKKG